MTTRIGKIARLPRSIRDQLNLRLDDGEVQKRLVDWLNSLPEVQAVLRNEFDGEPISEPNLSRWKQGGFRDWQSQQRAVDIVRELPADTRALTKATTIPVSHLLAQQLAARFALAARSSPAPVRDPDTLHQREQALRREYRRLRGLCRDIVALRKSDLLAARVALERKRLDLEERRLQMNPGAGAPPNLDPDTIKSLETPPRPA